MSSPLILPHDLSIDESAHFAEMPSGLIVPRDIAEQELSQRPTCVDLFCGCGGFSLGMLQGGFQVVAAVDSDPTAAITYTMNLASYPCQFHFVSDEDNQRLEKELQKHMRGNGIKEFPTAGSAWIADHPDIPGVGHFFLGDIRQIRGENILEAVGLDVGELDCVVGGPPCQGFSYAGRRNVLDPRNSLVFEFARLVCEMKPKAMVLENVPGMIDMVTPEGTPVVDALCRVLEDGGFAGYDALRRSLAAQSGTAGLMRQHRVKGRKKDERKPPKIDDEGQLSLFAPKRRKRGKAA